jgi:hypothetical protein
VLFLDQRLRSLEQRAAGVGAELGEWAGYTEAGKPLEKNASQLGAVGVFFDQYKTRLEAAMKGLRKAASAQPPNPAGALDEGKAVDDRIAGAHKVWGYFRDKLAQRFVPRFTESLLAADLIAHDCYRTVMDRAEKLGIPHALGLRDYPLTFFQSEYTSPVTAMRGLRVRELDSRPLPVPVLGIPWDLQASPRDYLSLHHEVGHDLDVDLLDPATRLTPDPPALSDEIAATLAAQLTDGGVPADRVAAWRKWVSEIFADFVGILLAGPAFAGFLASYLAWPTGSVYRLAPSAPHPTPFLRILLNTRFIRSLGIPRADADADKWAKDWEALYAGAPAELKPYAADFDGVIKAIADTPLKGLTGKDNVNYTLRNLAEFTPADYDQQLALADELWNGDATKFPPLPIRHVSGAAYVALEKSAGYDPAAIERVSSAAVALILRLAPKGQLGIRGGKSEKYLRALADACYDAGRVTPGEAGNDPGLS